MWDCEKLLIVCPYWKGWPASLRRVDDIPNAVDSFPKNVDLILAVPQRFLYNFWGAVHSAVFTRAEISADVDNQGDSAWGSKLSWHPDIRNMEPAWEKVHGRKFALLRNTLSPKAIPRHADKDDRIKRTVVGKKSPCRLRWYGRFYSFACILNRWIIACPYWKVWPVSLRRVDYIPNAVDSFPKNVDFNPCCATTFFVQLLGCSSKYSN